MTNVAKLMVGLLVMLLAVPTGIAEWKGRGFYEPDTSRDLTGGWMFTAPATSGAADKVYFSAYGGQYVETSNPNLGTTGSNILAYPTNIHFMLGAWRDCNGDGYIGLADSAALEYRAELLTIPTLANNCPAVATPDPIPAGWFPSHNDGQWVREFLWIGPDDVAADATQDGCYEKQDFPECTRAVNDTNPFNIGDHNARVWADWGLPEDAAKGTCPVNPRPRGTYQSTGGFVRFVDCVDNWRVTGAVNSNLGGLDGTAGQQVTFDDAAYNRPDQSRSLLNQENPYGQQEDAPVVSVFDCSADPTLDVQDPTYDGSSGATHQEFDDTADLFTGDTFWVNASGDDNGYDGGADEGYTVAHVGGLRGVPAVNPAGSPAGTVNETLEGATGDCDRSDGGSGQTSDVYSQDEADFEGTLPLRVQSDISGYFVEGTRDDESTQQAALLAQILGKGRPGDVLAEGPAYMQTGDTSWFGTPGYAVSRNPYVNRDDLSLWGAVYVTAYAYVTPTAKLALPSANVGTYGTDHCNGSTAIDGAWECDSSRWWRQADGTVGRNIWNAVTGDSFDLMDIDCYDATVAKGTPSAVGVASGRFCAR